MALMGVHVERHAVGMGALAGCSIAVPFQVALLAFDLPENSNWWVAANVVGLVAFTLAGFRAAAEVPDAPLTHGALAGAATYVALAIVAVTVGSIADDNGTSGGQVVARVFLSLLLSSSAGMIGGLVATRRPQRPPPDAP
jgi:hypothetical protein